MSTNQLQPITSTEQKQTESLLYALDRYASVCCMRLRGLITVCDQHIEIIYDGRISDWCFDHVFNELEALTDKICQISWEAMQNKTLQNEIRAKLLSSNREQHDELYYGLIKNIYVNLGGCIDEIEKYMANQEVYNNFIKVRHSVDYMDVRDDATKENDTNNALRTLSKLAPGGIYGSTLFNSAKHIRYAIRSVIPTSNIHKILPVSELDVLVTSNDQEPEPAKPAGKKTRKKEHLTHKQQMILVELLGLYQHPLLINLKPKQKGIILGELLNRSVDDTENMLNPETSKGNEKLNWNTEYDRGRVNQFLRNNGVDLT